MTTSKLRRINRNLELSLLETIGHNADVLLAQKKESVGSEGGMDHDCEDDKETTTPTATKNWHVLPPKPKKLGIRSNVSDEIRMAAEGLLELSRRLDDIFIGMETLVDKMYD